MTRIAAGLLILFASPAARAETAVQHLLENKMFSKIKDYDAALNGTLGVATIDLTSGRIFVYNGEAVFPTASVIKIPIMVEMFRAIKQGEFKLTDKVTIQPSESVPGSGSLQNALRNGPQTMSVHALLTAMIEQSDNTATNRAIAMAKMDRVNRFVDSLGFRTIRLRRIMMDSAAAIRGDENTASPLEMARLVEMLYRGKLGDADATAKMIALMKLVKGGVRESLPADIETATKTGSVPGVQCEAGIVYLSNRPYVISVFSTFVDEGVSPVGGISKIVFEYFSKVAASNEYGHKVR